MCWTSRWRANASVPALINQVKVAESALAVRRGQADIVRNRMSELKELPEGVVRAQKI
jgi:hypothetical protein